MARRGGSRSAFSCFVHEQLPELERRGLPVARVADAVPYCSQAWAVRAEWRRGRCCRLGWAGLGRRLGAISSGCPERPQVALPCSPKRGECLCFVCRGRGGGILGWQELREVSCLWGPPPWPCWVFGIKAYNVVMRKVAVSVRVRLGSRR